MRRSDKEIVDKSLIDKILTEAETIRIAVVDEGNPDGYWCRNGDEGRSL